MPLPVTSGGGWLFAAAGACALLCLLPLIALTITGFGSLPFDLGDVRLSNYFSDTLVLLVGIAIIAGTMGTVLGWIVTRFSFPQRRMLEWLAILPMAFPGYVISLLAADAMSFAGPVQSSLRNVFGWSRPEDYYFPDVRSAFGAAVILSLVLYPYVYLAARTAFLKQPQSQTDAARTLGKTALGAFLSVELPAALPAIAIGVIFALLEALNDIGAAQVFGVQTFTYGIYVLWLGENNLGAAARLALLLFIGIVAVAALERKAHGLDLRFHGDAKAKPPLRQPLTGMGGLLAVVAFAVPVMLGFGLPLLALGVHALPRFADGGAGALVTPLLRTLVLAGLAGIITVALGLLLAYGRKLKDGPMMRALLSWGTMGYGLPGTVLAIGLMTPFGVFDRWLNSLFGTGLLLSGSIAGLVIGHVIRFIAMPYRMIDAGARRITPSLDAAGRSLGRNGWRNFTDVHVPLLRPVLVASAIVVFVDAMKELPMTLLMRPFDFDTLATKVFDAASQSQIEEAALPALAIVIAGLVPVAWLSRQFKHVRRRN